MPNKETAKTKSARNKPSSKKIAYYSVGVLLALFALAAPSIFRQPTTAKFRVGDKTVTLEIAASKVARGQGLGGRKSMPKNEGMLFVFPKSGDKCLWMKDMNFSLDMIFLNSSKQIGQINRNVSPQTYPKNFCAANARYAVELNSGQAGAMGLHVGQKLEF